MKARPFAYTRVSSLEAAIAAYAACEGEARYLAGGQSLLAALNLRLDAPDLLIDIAHVDALRGVERIGDELRIGALTRHAEVLASPLIAEHAPLLTKAAAFVAHPAIRNKGTMGGSLALADPASEFPACMLALNARLEIVSATGLRVVSADDFFKDLYETALEPGEILSAIRIPIFTAGQRFTFDELARRRGDYAIVGLAAQGAFTGERIDSIRLAFFSVAATPVRARAAEDVLRGKALDSAVIVEAQAALDADLEPSDDVHVSGASRLHLAKVMLKRSLLALQKQGGSLT